MDHKGRFAKWDPAKKKARFYHSMDEGGIYSYEDCFRIWQNIGMTDRYTIRRLHKHPTKGLILV